MTENAFIIRDALDTDIDACLALDASYETELVWQMVSQPHSNGWQISFRTEKLPREIALSYPQESEQLSRALPTHAHAFLVAENKQTHTIMGYLLMQDEPVNGIVTVSDLLISREYRRNGIGTRLLSVARRWATEQQAHRLQVVVQTKNYPAIQFCQRRGFSFCGYNDHYFSDHEIAVFFGQTL